MRRAARLTLLFAAITLLGTVAGTCWWPAVEAQEPQVVAPTLHPDSDAVVIVLANGMDRPVLVIILADDSLSNLVGEVAALTRGIFVVPSSSLANVRTVRVLVQPSGAPHGEAWPSLRAHRVAGKRNIFLLEVPPIEEPKVKPAAAT